MSLSKIQYSIIIKGEIAEYKILKPIRFSNVYKGDQLGKDDKQIKQVAIKKITKVQEGDTEKYKNEYEIIKKLSSPYIVPLFDFSIMDENFYIIQELCSDTLREYIDKQQNIPQLEEFCQRFWHQSLPRLSNNQKFLIFLEFQRPKIEELQKQAIDIIAQILAGYLNLIENYIVHRNLNPDNILFNGNWKISSFASSRTLLDYKAQIFKTNTGSVNYQSPQQGKNQFTSKCDIYSIGIIFFELIFGFGPLTKKGSDQSQNYPFTDDFDSSHIDKNIKNFIIGCLKYEENDRIEWKDLYRHEVFKNTILTTNEEIKKLIVRIEELLVPNVDPLNQLQMIFKNKLNQIRNTIKKVKRKRGDLIQWSFFYREIKKIDPEISSCKISKCFCLIDQESKGCITKTQFQNWIDKGQTQYTFGEIVNNKVLGCILTLEKTMEKFEITLQQIFDNYGDNNELDYESFRSLLKNIDSSISDISIDGTFQHLKCNQKLKKIKYETMKIFLQTKFHQESKVQNQENNQMVQETDRYLDLNQS